MTDGTDNASGNAPLQTNTIRATCNGPLEVFANFRIGGEGPGAGSSGAETWLCRCGQSATKPFCDGSHKTAAFACPGEPESREIVELSAPHGLLEINPMPNGPLKLAGNMEILADSGRLVLRAQKAALCRCGLSAMKPFCDGSHRQSGFEAP